MKERKRKTLAVSAMSHIVAANVFVPAKKESRRESEQWNSLAGSAEALHNHLLGPPSGRKNGAQEGGIGCDMHIYIRTCRHFHMNEAMVLTRAAYTVPG